MFTGVTRLLTHGHMSFDHGTNMCFVGRYHEGTALVRVNLTSQETGAALAPKEGLALAPFVENMRRSQN